MFYLMKPGIRLMSTLAYKAIEMSQRLMRLRCRFKNLKIERLEKQSFNLACLPRRVILQFLNSWSDIHKCPRLISTVFFPAHWKFRAINEYSEAQFCFFCYSVNFPMQSGVGIQSATHPFIPSQEGTISSPSGRGKR